MKKFLMAMTLGAVVALSSAGALSAQPWHAGLAGEDVLSVGLRLGAVSPTTTLPDGSKFSGGIGGGISATYWPFRHVGVRLNTDVGRTEGNNVELAPASWESPTVVFTGGELNLRYPVVTESVALAPLVGVGAGAKWYDWPEDVTGTERDLIFAWNLTAGLDIRRTSSPWFGLVLEAKRYSSKYVWHGMLWEEPRVTDLFFSVGISLNR